MHAQSMLSALEHVDTVVARFKKKNLALVQDKVMNTTCISGLIESFFEGCIYAIEGGAAVAVAVERRVICGTAPISSWPHAGWQTCGCILLEPQNPGVQNFSVIYKSALLIFLKKKGLGRPPRSQGSIPGYHGIPRAAEGKSKWPEDYFHK